MTLREIVDLILNEESDPLLVAKKLNSKEKEFDKHSKINADGLINILSNEAKNPKGFPIEKDIYINPNNIKEMDNYINKIRSYITIKNPKTLLAIDNILNTIKTKITDSYNLTHP